MVDLYTSLAAKAEEAQDRSTMFDAVVSMQEGADDSDQRPALSSTTLLTALSQTNPSGDIELQLGEQSIQAARDLLEMGKEKELRNKIAADRVQRQLGGLNKLTAEIGFKVDPETRRAAQIAYNNVLKTDYEKRAKTAIEEEAVERIQTMAARNPVQAKVLLDLLEKGDANETIKNFNVKMAVLHQRAEELDAEYQQSGWGRAILNFVLNLIPTNYNFARSGVVGDGSIGSFLKVGEGLRDQSERLWSMPMDEFAEYTAKDGPLMQSIRSNATTAFDLTADPRAAVEIMEALTVQTDTDRKWNNIWGGVEIASAVPWMKIGSATRTLMSAGAADAAVRNLDNAIRVMDEQGLEAATRATAVTEDEIVEELSVGAIRPRSAHDVPLAEQVATRREAATKALDELFAQPEGNRFRTMEEMKAAFDATVEEITKTIGRPIKNIWLKRESLPGGQHVNVVEYIFGKKDGHGFASEKAAKNAYRKSGIGGEVIEVVETAGRVAPSKYKLTQLSRQDGPDGTMYKYSVSTDKEDIPITIAVGEDGVGYTSVGGLSTNELGAKEVRALAAQLADEIPELKTLEGIRVTGARKISGDKPDGTNATINIEALRGRIQTVQDMTGQWFIRGRKTMNETGFFTDPLHPNNEGFLSRTFGRFVRAAPRVSDETLHGAAIEGGEYLNRAHKAIQGQVMSTFAELPKQSRELIRMIALKGAEQERWFNPEEVHFLTDRLLGRRASDAEIDAYAKYQLYNDMDWELRNTALYLEKTMQGRESAQFRSPWGEDFDLDVAIDYNLNKIPLERVYDASMNRHYVHGRNPLTTAELDKLSANGYVMLHVPEGFRIPEAAGSVTVNRVLIKKSDITISPLRREQLNYAPGGHRMYADKIFVKQGAEGVQSDTGSKFLLSPKTFRTAKNIAEGRKWADKMNEAREAVRANQGISEVELDDLIFQNDPAFPTGREFLDAVDDGTISLNNPFEAVWDRDLPSMYQTTGMDVTRLFNEDDLGITGYFRTTGRMYLSPKGEILKDTTGKVADILDPYDTLTQSLQQVTRNIGLFNYKTQALDRFHNTYGKYLDIAPNHRSPTQILLDSNVLKDVPMELRNQIEAQRAAITNVLRYETPVDKMRRQMWQSVAEWVLGDGTNPLRKVGHDAVWWFRDNNPVSKMRGLAFDMKLGIWNPGQLLVQVSTMVSATALSPKYGLQGMSGIFPMHAYLLSKGSENVLDTLVKRGVDKVMGFENSQEFKEFARHLNGHGFADMNGSHIMINDFGPHAHFGTFENKFNKMRENSRVFFYTAETWNRLVAYRIAWGEVKDKGIRPNDLNFTSEIMRLADDYSMNMTGESAAFWQKGILSIPTQFWAYNVRMMDAMFGKRFTPAQRMRLALSHFALMGTVGIPILPAFTEYLKGQHGSSPPIDSLQGVLDRGLIDYINYELTNNDILISERVGTGGWAGDVVKSLFGASEYGEKSFADLVGGATYSIAKSVGKSMWDFSKYAAAESGSDIGDVGLKEEGFLRLLREVSTFGNVTKAMLIHQYGMYKSNKGTIIASDLPESSAVYAALSFRPTKAREIQYMMKWREDHRKSVQEIATQMRNWRQEALINPDKMEENMRKANALMRLLPPTDRRDVIRQTNKITDKSFYDHLERKVLEEQAQVKGIEE